MFALTSVPLIDLSLVSWFVLFVIGALVALVRPAELVRDLLLYSMIALQQEDVTAIDAFVLARSGYRARRTQMNPEQLHNGWFLEFLSWKSPLVLQRMDRYHDLEAWEIFALRHSDLVRFRQMIQDHFLKDKDLCIKVTRTNLYHNPFSFHVLKPQVSSLFPFQKKILDLCPPKDPYRTSVFLISGPPGVGKTATAKLVLLKLLKTAPSTVFIDHFDLMLEHPCLGQLLHKIRGNRCTPLVLTCNEIDVAFEQALKTEKAKFFSAEPYVAYNKTSMTSFLDSLHEFPYLYIFMTTNHSLADLRSKYEAFVRPGRVDYALEVSPNKVDFIIQGPSFRTPHLIHCTL